MKLVPSCVRTFGLDTVMLLTVIVWLCLKWTCTCSGLVGYVLCGVYSVCVLGFGVLYWLILLLDNAMLRTPLPTAQSPRPVPIVKLCLLRQCRL